MNEDQFLTLAHAIIKEQERVVGPLAWSEAEKVSGLIINNNKVSVTGDGKLVLEKLVIQYQNLFGQASVEVCKDAIKRVLDRVDRSSIPQILL